MLCISCNNNHLTVNALSGIYAQKVQVIKQNYIYLFDLSLFRIHVHKNTINRIQIQDGGTKLCIQIILDKHVQLISYSTKNCNLTKSKQVDYNQKI